MKNFQENLWKDFLVVVVSALSDFEEVEGDEMDSASYSSTLPSDESPVDYMPIFMSLVQVLEHFQRWRAIESFFNLLQIVLFLVLLLLT